MAAPALFLAHGSPMMAVEKNPYTEFLGTLGKRLRETADTILIVSAHWESNGTAVSASAHPQTIHDFGGFPQELYHIQYPAPGSPATAARAREILGDSVRIVERGLDHGAWQLMLHLFPEADMPVLQLSLDIDLGPEDHFELAQRLAPLRNEKIAIIGSGNIVHNLSTANWRNPSGPPADWAVEFDAAVADAVVNEQFQSLIDYPALSRYAGYAVPTDEHYLPLLYATAVKTREEKADFISTGFQHSTISMRSIAYGL